MMKKCLPAAALLVLLLLPAPPASAKENPFSELPADHWAYDALSSLAKDKLVTGPLVQRLQKSQTLTRYEMAELVARAMASADKADTADAARLTKLQTEFADELKTLGLRISSLEKEPTTSPSAEKSNIRLIVPWMSTAMTTAAAPTSCSSASTLPSPSMTIGVPPRILTSSQTGRWTSAPPPICSSL